MKGFIGVTDDEWFNFLSSLENIEEVNFWQPSGKRLFKALRPGQPFFFKLYSPRNYIVGGGFFAHSTLIPVSLAWEAFGYGNGARSLSEMRRLIEKKRRDQASPSEDYQIGVILLQQPFFFHEKDWIPVPPNFSKNIVQGKGYDLTSGYGLKLWEDVQLRLKSQNIIDQEGTYIGEEKSRYGEPTLISPRLGQGSFRVMVTDAYQRECAVTHEKVLPALEAAHIKPFSEGGDHKITNGLLLRSDVHKLFDRGYVTVSPDNHFEVSRKVKEDFHNGREYYAFHGKRIYIPPKSDWQPNRGCLTWHNEKVFKG